MIYTIASIVTLGLGALMLFRTLYELVEYGAPYTEVRGNRRYLTGWGTIGVLVLWSLVFLGGVAGLR